MIDDALKEGVVAQAFAHGDLDLNLVNPRDFAQDIHQTVDDRPFGGGDGMIMMAEPLRRAVDSVKNSEGSGQVIYLSPHGEKFSNAMAVEMGQSGEITLVCGRYGGVDQRFIDGLVDREVSLGDYVLSGGELGALVMVDAIARFIPGVLGNPESAHSESFSQGLLEGPQYTRPRSYGGRDVPSVLLSGDHARIKQWRRQVAILYTWGLRPELLKRAVKDGLVKSDEIGLAHRYWLELDAGERDRIFAGSMGERLDPELLKC